MLCLTYPASFGLEIRTIEISRVAGAGGERTWHILIDRFLEATAHQVGTEIRVHPRAASWMSGDDMVALIDVIREMDQA